MDFYHFELRYILVAILISSLACVLGIRYSAILKSSQRKVKDTIAYSLIIGFIFTLNELMIDLTIGLPFQNTTYFVSIGLSFIIWSIGSMFVLYVSQNQLKNNLIFFIFSTILTLFLLSIYCLNFDWLFHRFVDFKPMYFIITVMLTFAASVAVLSFLMQITNQGIYTKYVVWFTIGSIFGGILFSGIPYITIVALLRTSREVYNSNTLFLPYLFMLAAIIATQLLLNLFSSKILNNHQESYIPLFKNNPDAVFLVDLNGVILNFNHEAELLTGYSRDELLTMKVMDLLVNKNKAKTILNEIIQGKTVILETKLIKSSSAVIDVRITSVTITNDNEIIGAYGIVRDITEVKRNEERISFLAYHDELTNLPNRRKLEIQFNALKQSEASFALLFFDFNRFKRINDTYGHRYGDAVLKALADKLKDSVEPSAILSRIGGDEFCVLLPSHREIETNISGLLNEFSKPITVEGNEFHIEPSIGIALYPDDGECLEDLLKYADIAMYKAKEDNEYGYSFFSKDLYEGHMNQIEMENELKTAILNNELFVHYQPKINSKTNKIIGSEALARWISPSFGNVSPAVFIKIAEDTHMVVQLERAIIESVFRDLTSWKKQGLNFNRVSINLSAIQLHRNDFLNFFIGKMKLYGISGHDLELEVTESIMLNDVQKVNQTLTALKEIGIEISIDDFGKGYSSLSYLHNLAIDRLKIDKSFIDDLQKNPQIVKTIVSLAKQLNLKVIAEGVEHHEQVILLKDLECFDIQGYYYSPPVSANRLLEFYKPYEKIEA